MSEQLKRSLLILEMLPRFPKSISVSKIREHLINENNIDVSIRTIQRDLVTFETMFGILKHNEGWCWNEESQSISIPGLTLMQALTLHLSKSYLSTLMPSSTLSELKPFFDQAESKIKNNQFNKIVGWKKKVTIIQQTQQLLQPDIDADVQKVVSTGLMNDNQLRIIYCHSDGEEKEYTINPIGLVLKNGVTYLITELSENSYVQIFSLHRIRKAEDLYKGFQRDAAFDIQNYIEREHLYFGIFNYNSQSSRNVYSQSKSEIIIKLIFTKNAFKNLAETPLSKDQKSEWLDKDHVQITATIQYTDQLVCWLRAYSTEVEVIEPEYLRERIIEDIQQLNFKYKII